jgi:hypothetical protein
VIRERKIARSDRRIGEQTQNVSDLVDFAGERARVDGGRVLHDEPGSSDPRTGAAPQLRVAAHEEDLTRAIDRIADRRRQAQKGRAIEGRQGRGDHPGRDVDDVRGRHSRPLPGMSGRGSAGRSFRWARTKSDAARSTQWSSRKWPGQSARFW